VDEAETLFTEAEEQNM